ncbi:MAG: hypothetical protein Q8L81_12615 [Bacteroidota bacterium]|nr:hypothetical protein [Bacteroidota bacterium]
MINKIIFSLIAVIFLSSCANKFSLTKRKYTKGYYFASSKNNSSGKKENGQKEVVAKHLNKKNSVLPVESTSAIEIKNEPVLVFTNNETVLIKKVASKHAASNITASAKTKEQFTSKPHFKVVAKEQPFNKDLQKKGSSDANFVLMVILCFFPFINLIPVYLHDGKKVTLNFIITLILDFTWVLGVVYALLVILDVVDLA